MRANLLKEKSYPSPIALSDQGDQERFEDFYQCRDHLGGVKKGQLCNTPPSNPQELTPGGYDTLEIKLFGEWRLLAYNKLLEQLERAKKAAGAGGGDVVLSVGPNYEDEIAVKAHGVPGVPYCEFCFEWQGMTFGMVKKHDYKENRFSLRLSVGSVACMEYGGLQAWHYARAFIERLGFRLKKTTVSRADFCVDLAGVDCHEVAVKYLSGCAVARGRKYSFHGENRDLTGFTIGSGRRVSLRVYDKIKELGQSVTGSIKRAILIKSRWGELPEKATRIEYQLRREALTDFGVDDIDDLFSRSDEICAWLTKKWFRLTEKPVQGKHHERAVTCSLWADVQALFSRAFGDWKKPIERKKRSVSAAVEPLVKQALGCLSSAAAAVGLVACSAADVVAYVQKEVEAAADDLLQVIREKRILLEVKNPGVPLPRPALALSMPDYCGDFKEWAA